MIDVQGGVSVVMSVHNCDRYIGEAIESILGQTFRNYEVIIINDGSTDKTLDIIELYKSDRVRVIDQGKMGLARALNKGFRLAKGRYIARLDADDISLPHRLARQHEFMENHPECVASGSNAMIIDAEGRYLYCGEIPVSWGDIQSMLPYNSPFFHSSVIIRREAALACGGYYEKTTCQFQDLVLWNKLAKYGELSNLEEALIKYRLVPFSITNDYASNRRVKGEITKRIVRDGDISDEELRTFVDTLRKQGEGCKISNYYCHLGGIYLLKVNDRWAAIKNICFSIAHYPINYRAWFFLLLCMASSFNGNIVNVWKRYRHIG
jgi:glycosyltransferase involved in cell wall biosynthesis